MKSKTKNIVIAVLAIALLSTWAVAGYHIFVQMPKLMDK